MRPRQPRQTAQKGSCFEDVADRRPELVRSLRPAVPISHELSPTYFGSRVVECRETPQVCAEALLGFQVTPPEIGPRRHYERCYTLSGKIHPLATTRPPPSARSGCPLPLPTSWVAVHGPRSL